MMKKWKLTRPTNTSNLFNELSQQQKLKQYVACLNESLAPFLKSRGVVITNILRMLNDKSTTLASRLDECSKRRTATTLEGEYENGTSKTAQ